MALYLVQHGKNLPKDKDPHKGLSEKGLAEIKRIAEVAAQYGVKVSKILHSGKTRAKQTAQVFASLLHIQSEIEQVDGINPLDDVTVLAKKLDSEENIMIVGHLPFMEKLTSYLVVGSDEYPIFKFQNGGIVCLDKEPDFKRWIIKWTLMPNIG
ncbi:MAG: phosphohistidine phosphatase SixA [Desulfobacterales bacterium]